MQFKKKNGQQLGSEGKKIGVKSEKLVTWNIRQKK